MSSLPLTKLAKRVAKAQKAAVEAKREITEKATKGNLIVAERRKSNETAAVAAREAPTPDGPSDGDDRDDEDDEQLDDEDSGVGSPERNPHLGKKTKSKKSFSPECLPGSRRNFVVPVRIELKVSTFIEAP